MRTADDTEAMQNTQGQYTRKYLRFRSEDKWTTPKKRNWPSGGKKQTETGGGRENVIIFQEK